MMRNHSAALVLLLAACGGADGAENVGGEGGTGTQQQMICQVVEVSPNAHPGETEKLCVPEDWPHGGFCWETGEDCGAGSAHLGCVSWEINGQQVEPPLVETMCVKRFDCLGDDMIDAPACCAELPDGTTLPADCAG